MMNRTKNDNNATVFAESVAHYGFSANTEDDFVSGTERLKRKFSYCLCYGIGGETAN